MTVTLDKNTAVKAIKPSIDHKAQTMTFELNGESSTVKFTDYDEHGSVTLCGIIFDYHLDSDEELTITIYNTYIDDEGFIQTDDENPYANHVMTNLDGAPEWLIEEVEEHA